VRSVDQPASKPSTAKDGAVTGCARSHSQSSAIAILRKPSIMIFIDAIFLAVGLSFLARGFFELCVYALPTAAGIYALLFTYYMGAGVLGSLLIGLITGSLTLSAGRIAFARARSPALQIGVRLLYALPAFLVGYQTTLDLSNHAAPSEIWRQEFAIIGAIFVGYTAFIRIGQPAESAPGGV
jgi:hypothetical protein